MVALDVETGMSYWMIQIILQMRGTAQILFEIAGRWRKNWFREFWSKK